MGARLVAEFKPSTAQYFYYTQDQIGSSRVVTNDAGAVVYAEAHDPYGGIQKTWVNNFEPKRKFSDKERDEETGLDYFGARYYADTRYRWLSIDPLINTDRAITDPQKWNLYAFCRSNPISFTDPDGRSIIPTLGIHAAISSMMTYHILPWMSYKLALLFQFPLWTGTPWAETGEKVTKGLNGRADCGGLTHAVLKDAGYDYPWKGPNLKYRETNFALAVQKGGELGTIFRELRTNEKNLFGDIVLWNGKHIAIYAGQVNGQDMIFTTSSAGAKLMEMRWMNDSLGSAPTGYYRWLFH
jgi:RHS repeat-associated protein